MHVTVDQEKIQLLLSIQADLEVLKNVLSQFKLMGESAKKSANEADALGAALRAATEGHSKDLQLLNAELSKLRTMTTAASAAVTKLSAENATLTQTQAKLAAENAKMALQFEGSKNSIAGLQAEQRRLSAEVERLRGHLASATTGLVKLSDAQQQAATTAKTNTNAQKDQASSANSAALAFTGLQAVMSSAVTLAAVRMGQALVDAELEMQRVKMGLLASQGSAQAAGDSYGYVAGEADRLGLSMNGVLKPFTSFSIAASVSGLAADQTREIFTQFSEAGAVMSLKADEMEGVFRALSQMLSKGTVAAEELRGQLGERLPGAFELSARAMGVSTQQLGKMLEQGQVLSRDLLPKLGAELQKQFGGLVPQAAQTLQAELNRLDKSLFDLKNTINDAGFADEFSDTIKGLTELIRDMSDFARDNPQAVRDMGKALEAVAFGVFIAGLAGSVAGLAVFAATVPAAVVAASAFTATVGAMAAATVIIGQRITGAIEAYGEMRDAQLELEGTNGRINASLIKQAGEMRSSEEAARARSAALVQLAAAEKAYAAIPKNRDRRGNPTTDTEEGRIAKQQIDRLNSIIKLIDDRGAAIVANNLLEDDRLDTLKKQTAELEKQKSEIARRVALATKEAATSANENKFQKLYVENLPTSKAKLDYLQGKLNGVNSQIAQPFNTAGASTPQEIRDAFIAFSQRERELTIQKMELENQIADIKKAELAANKENEAAIERQIQDEVELINTRKKNAAAEEEQALSRKIAASQEQIALVNADRLLTSEEKNRLLVALLKAQNEEISKRIRLLEEAEKLSPDPARQANIDRLRAERSANSLTITKSTPLGAGDGVQAGVINTIDRFGTEADIVARGVETSFQGVFQGLSSSIQGLINGTMTWGDALQNIGSTILNSVIGAISDMFATWIVKRAAMGLASIAWHKEETANVIANEASALPVKTAGAVASGISSWGLALAGGIAALALIASLSGGFSEGGYTGAGGVNEPAGVVHRGEVVFSQADVRRLGGVQAVENLRVGNGGFPVMKNAASMSPVTSAASASPVHVDGAKITIGMIPSGMTPQQWANSQEGETHLVNMMQRNIHKITGLG